MLLTLIFSFSLFLCFHPLYNNYTSLMSSPYAPFYYLWVLYLSYTLCHNFLKTTNNKKIVYLLTLIFCLGSVIPYKSLPFFHVILPMASILLTILFLLLLINDKQKNEPLRAHLIKQWYFYGLSLLSLMIIFFGQINGIIEIMALFFICWMLYLLQH